jgi:hypothetical protein
MAPVPDRLSRALRTALGEAEVGVCAGISARASLCSGGVEGMRMDQTCG